MSVKELQHIARRLRAAAGRAYIAQQSEHRERIVRAETNAEVREAMRGWLAAERCV